MTAKRKAKKPSLLLILLLTVFVLSFFIIQKPVSVEVTNNFMEPTLKNGSIFSGAGCTGGFCKSSIERGSIVSFGVNEEGFVGRIIGLPGEKVIIGDSKVYVDQKLLIEPYLFLNASAKIVKRGACEIYQLEEDEYFVLGDNRVDAKDSRAMGPIKLSQISAYSKFSKYNNKTDMPYSVATPLIFKEKDCKSI